MGLVGAILGGALLGGIIGRSGGGGEQYAQPAAPAPQPAAAAAPPVEAADALEKKNTEDLYKKRRGKKGLLVNPLDKDKTSSNSIGTGLNI